MQGLFNLATGFTLGVLLALYIILRYRVDDLKLWLANENFVPKAAFGRLLRDYLPVLMTEEAVELLIKQRLDALSEGDDLVKAEVEKQLQAYTFKVIPVIDAHGFLSGMKLKIIPVKRDNAAYCRFEHVPVGGDIEYNGSEYCKKNDGCATIRLADGSESIRMVGFPPMIMVRPKR